MNEYAFTFALREVASLEFLPSAYSQSLAPICVQHWGTTNWGLVREGVVPSRNIPRKILEILYAKPCILGNICAIISPQNGSILGPPRFWRLCNSSSERHAINRRTDGRTNTAPNDLWRSEHNSVGFGNWYVRWTPISTHHIGRRPTHYQCGLLSVIIMFDIERNIQLGYTCKVYRYTKIRSVELLLLLPLT